MNTPNPKRPCYDVSSSIQQNPNSLPIAQNFDQSDFDSTISSFLLLPDSSPSPSTSIACSFDRVLGHVLSSASETSGDDSVQDRLIDHARKLASLLHESTNRFSRKRASLYNYNSWSLPHELTINVFSMLDTKSMIRAAASCTIFQKCAMDPLCYSHIDLIMAKHVNDEVVCSLIHRAGKELRSLKLGRVARQAKPSLTSSGLASLFLNHVFNGDLLRSLHLYNLVLMGTKSLCALLSVCPNLTDLKIVDFDRKYILARVIQTLTRNRRSIIKHLFLENRTNFTASGIKFTTVEAFATSCPNLSSLTLIGFGLNEETARNLALGFPKLKYMDLSRTHIIGRFLRDLRNSCKDSPLETLILRDCLCLNEVAIRRFLESLINGDFRFIRHVDVLCKLGYFGDGSWKVLIPKLKEKRSDVTFVANCR